ncbi:transposase family protein [Aeromonas fluvialis]|nr:transposase family protein [Aeromonas fluvialis]
MRTWVETLLQMLPLSHISRLTGLHWHTIKAIDRRRLHCPAF